MLTHDLLYDVDMTGPTKESFRLMIVAGEPSGDAHAASLVGALREAAPEIQMDFFGATGPLMRAAGVEPIIQSDHLSISGSA